jgi:hypothetical protein
MLHGVFFEIHQSQHSHAGKIPTGVLIAPGAVQASRCVRDSTAAPEGSG